jgi:hypothetical protein
MVGRKDDLPALHGSFESIARAKPKPSPDRTGKNHLPLAGNAGLHGKNILPREGLGAQYDCRTAVPENGAGVHAAVMGTVDRFVAWKCATARTDAGTAEGYR